MSKLPSDWEICRKRISSLDLTENSMILDIGSEDGRKAHYIVNKGKLTMSDIRRRKISPFVLCEATNLPFKDSSFDLVTILHVIEHIKDDKMVLRETYRILKNGGAVLVVTPNANRLTKIYSILIKVTKKSPDRYPLNPDHVFEHDLLDIKNMLSISEFQNYTIEPIFMKISRFLRIRKYCDQWIITAKK
jgi:demethylmenaquinone methyltransferase/2-methoxy-6-polyprenyl-1,4-benzoquinol methylase